MLHYCVINVVRVHYAKYYNKHIPKRYTTPH